jgi:hypothetical protein
LTIRHLHSYLHRHTTASIVPELNDAHRKDPEHRETFYGLAWRQRESPEPVSPK